MKFVKRFFVFDLDQGAIVYYSKQQDQTPSDVIPLSQILEVRKDSGVDENQELISRGRLGSETRGQLSRGGLTSSKCPGDGWTYILEIFTLKRSYKLFSNSYDVKEQWFYALRQVVKHKELLEEEHRQKIKQRVRQNSCKPSSTLAQGKRSES